MDRRRNPFFWSVRLGTLPFFQVEVRASLFLLIGLGLLLFKFKLALGLTLGLILCFSTLWHELGHVLAARSVGLTAKEVLIWPFGGLAITDDPPTPKAQMFVAMAGPIVNFVLCLMTVTAVFTPDRNWGAFDPFTLPIAAEGFGKSGFDNKFWNDSLQLMFSINWMLFLVNLIPANPLDGGRVLRAWLTRRFGLLVSNEAAPRFAYLAAGVLIIVGIFGDHTALMGLAILLILMAQHEASRNRRPQVEMPDDTFLGYDFSEGYTSLERSQQRVERDHDLESLTPEASSEVSGFMERVRERREADRRRREQELEREHEEVLDQILAKLHVEGMDALSEAERKHLKQASDRYRAKGRNQAE